jgi:Ca2+-binding EF-hand superfamily protein
MKSFLRSLLFPAGAAALTLSAFADGGVSLGVGAGEFARLDANQDGLVSPAENTAGAKALFREADANRDDILTVAELAIAQDNDDRDHSPKSSVLRGIAPAEVQEAAEQIKAVDQNGDGQATSAELLTGTQQMFALMDVNHDGYLDAAECEAGAAS